TRRMTRKQLEDLRKNKPEELEAKFKGTMTADLLKPLFTITKANMAQYADKLTEGHKKLLTSFDSYKMNVYPSHRTVGWPDEIYAATKANATTCELVNTEILNN
ncbi:UNVERIFIED_CONTAM: DUF1329 domain-containing protein, partial [Salmonella enterica subsp. enterica serovar Weltevreden]